MKGLDMSFIIEIVKLVLTGVAIFITQKLIPFMIANTTEKDRQSFFYYAKLAVSGAEQLQKDGRLDIPKKDYVMDFMRKKLGNMGIEVTELELNTVVEGFVNDLNLKQKEAEGDELIIYPNQDSIGDKINRG